MGTVLVVTEDTKCNINTTRTLEGNGVSSD